MQKEKRTKTNEEFAALPAAGRLKGPYSPDFKTLKLLNFQIFALPVTEYGLLTTGYLLFLHTLQED